MAYAFGLGVLMDWLTMVPCPQRAENERRVAAAIETAKERYAAMTMEEQQVMWAKQRESWARQDFD